VYKHQPYRSCTKGYFYPEIKVTKNKKKQEQTTPVKVLPGGDIRVSSAKIKQSRNMNQGKLYNTTKNQANADTEQMFLTPGYKNRKQADRSIDVWFRDETF